MADEEVKFRRAAGEDVEALSALTTAAYQHYIPRIGRPPAPMEKDFAEAVRDDEVWVAVQDGAIIALIVLAWKPDHLLVQNLAVLPAAQGRGIGTALLALAEDQAERHGLHELRLYTNEAMTENIAYYPRRGFTETHRAGQDGYRRVFFTKPLG